MLIIGIAGGSGCGKSTVVKQIIKKLPKDSVSILPQDSYYKDNGHLSQEERARINFDHPSSIEFNLLIKHVDLLKEGQTIGMPIYSYLTCARAKETIPVEPREVVIVEGILIMSNPRLRDRMDIKVFVDADADDRLMRIIRRDIEERGRSFSQVLDHYERFVKPMHLQFIEPTKRYADIIVPQGGANHVAIDILTSRIKMNLKDKI
ncbi:uridine kinase [Lentimicrobium sp.]|jgi:uridine kinase|uniref:uridine kinase n=1 Tax=Lentimicrobium sp. TaxID=2034841 RepID=UPI0025CB8929|nr:uridine kinase [Lentimicrobium sp.]MCO5256385.1 uridine kinase [Lentimicrobium sp.]MCO5262388.1 uridine kinase [Lentimicrobium sp.]HOP13479.1 uridine kinase [Lentimicrobium sp.]HPF64163.1 uridine kinase [Lentimicrobium sp.]HPJ61992.1 uridine kinase [Lentimicrobium sp.]